VLQCQFIECQVEVDAADECRTAQDVSFDPTRERAAQDQDQLAILGKM
jgi:hypothetical protein